MITVPADTLVELHAGLEAAQDALGEVAAKLAALIPEPAPQRPVLLAREPDTRVVTSLRMSPELMIALKALAVRERVRVNDVVIEAIQNHLALKQAA